MRAWNLLFALLALGLAAPLHAGKQQCNGEDPRPCCPDTDPCCECCVDSDCDDGDECTEDVCQDHLCDVEEPEEGDLPEVVDFQPTAAGTFLDLGEYDNDTTTEIDWKCYDPGQVRFEFSPSGATFTETAQSSSVQRSFNMRQVLDFGGLAPKRNTLTITPITTDGEEGEPFEFKRFGSQKVPAWMAGIALSGGSGFTGQNPKFNVELDPLKITADYHFKNFGNATTGYKYDMKLNYDSDPTNLLNGAWGLILDPFEFHGEYAVDPDQLSGSFEVQVGASFSGTRYQKKNLFGKSMYKVLGRNYTVQDTGEIAVNVHASGQVHPKLALTEAGASASLSGKLPIPRLPRPFFIPPLPIPFYWQIEIGAGVEVHTKFTQTDGPGIGGSHLEWQGVSAPSVKMHVAGTIGAGVKVSDDFALAGVEGTGTLWGTMTPGSWSPSLTDFSGSAGLHGKVEGLFLWWSYTIVEGHLVQASWYPFNFQWLVSGSPPLADGGGPVWKLDDRPWAARPGTMEPAGKGQHGTLGEAGGPEPILSNVWPGSQPAVLATHPDTWVALDWDDASLPQEQALEIGVLRHDGVAWSALQPVTDDLVPDVRPALAQDGSHLVVAWCRFPGLAAGETPPTGSTKSEIAWSVYDPSLGDWSAPALVTNDQHQDWPPALVRGEDGSLRLFWLSASDGSLPVTPFSTAPVAATLMSATWNGRGFDPPQVEIPGLFTDALPAVRVSAVGTLQALWSAHTDGDPRTLADLEVFVAERQGTAWAPPHRLTTNGTADAGTAWARTPQGAPLAVWIQAGPEEDGEGNPLETEDRVLVATASSGSWDEPVVAVHAHGIAGVHVVTDPANEVWIHWSTSSGNVSDLWAARYDAQTASWSHPVQLTDDPGVERGAAVVPASGGALRAIYLRQAFDQPAEPPPPGGTAYATLGQADLVWTEHVPAVDLAVDEDEVDILPFDAYPGEPVTVSLRLRNLGLEPATTATVRVYGNDPSSGGVALQEFSVVPGPFLGGTDAVFTFSWVLPQTGGLYDLYVVADPDGVLDEADETNNVAVVELYAPDLKGTMETRVACGPAPGFTVQATISNDGSASTNDLVSWRLERADGSLLDAGAVAMPLPGEAVSFPVELEEALPLTTRLLVDPDDLIEEVNESGDTAFVTFWVDKPGNVDHLGGVNIDDLLAVIQAWGSCADCDADLTGDGLVNIDDLLIVIGSWGGCP